MKYAIISLSIATAILSGCSSPATSEGMMVNPSQINKAIPSSKFYSSVKKVSVDGGKETNPLWTSQVSSENFQLALVDSLKAANVWSDSGKYSLEANLLSLEQPLIGFNMTVSASVDYKVKDETTGTVIFGEKIDSTHTATVGDAVAGIKRLRLANEGAIRNNIELFLKKLSEK
jgi:hypothetical protein